MHFAQKTVLLEWDGAGAVRGSLAEADIGEYTDAVAGSWDADFVQLEGGPLDAGIEYLAGDRFVLYREHWSRLLHTRGAVLPGTIAIGIPSDSGFEDRWWGRSLPSGQIPFGRSNHELDLVSASSDGIIVLAMEETAFFEAFHRMTGLDPHPLFNGGHLLAVYPDRLHGLRRFWNHVLAVTKESDFCEVGLLDLVAALADTIQLPGRVLPSAARSAGVVGRVLHTAEKAGFKANVPELSHRLGISRRAIEYAFREHLGISPHAYLMLRRLNLCRKTLISADPRGCTVTSVATEFGFHELGRFASTYRRLFGELPSESLRKPASAAEAAVSRVR